MASSTAADWKGDGNPFDTIGVPSRHISITPPSQEVFDTIVARAKSITEPERMKLLPHAERCLIPYSHGEVDQAAHALTDATGMIDPEKWAAAYNEFIAGRNFCYTRKWKPEFSDWTKCLLKTPSPSPQEHARDDDVPMSDGQASTSQDGHDSDIAERPSGAYSMSFSSPTAFSTTILDLAPANDHRQHRVFLGFHREQLLRAGPSSTPRDDARQPVYGFLDDSGRMPRRPHNRNLRGKRIAKRYLLPRISTSHHHETEYCGDFVGLDERQVHIKILDALSITNTAHRNPTWVPTPASFAARRPGPQ
ncbi:hypothetical protein Micbo1qcDRAFT_216605 [Microdochium bolleyi]|uniref:Uncharacterized protein n=1 Tax=Microdochium bolleyi TaxID=196109 RepID=A0A136JCT1_9PEZI|nr:hypothetical protein Micbo1qcDRAFT_216605 [Microdochium bolleyi]